MWCGNPCDAGNKGADREDEPTFYCPMDGGGLRGLSTATRSRSKHQNRENIMPLKKGSSNSTVSSNIKTLVDDWKKDGSIGTSHPPTKNSAIKQAVAIALSSADRSHKTHRPGRGK
jgi:hypothetical protein